MPRTGVRHWRRVAVTVAVATLFGSSTAGCSWMLVARPPEGPVEATEPLQCTIDTAAPMVDAVMGAAAIATGALAVVLAESGGPCVGGTQGVPASQCPANKKLTRGGYGAVAFGIVAGLSAGSGLRWTARCREMERLQRACLAGVEPSCASLRERPSNAPRLERPRSGFAAGEACATDAECRPGLACRYGRCAAGATW